MCTVGPMYIDIFMCKYVHLGEKGLLPALLHICQVSIQAIGQVRYGLVRSSPLTTIDRYVSPLRQARQLVAAMDLIFGDSL